MTTFKIEMVEEIYNEYEVEANTIEEAKSLIIENTLEHGKVIRPLSYKISPCNKVKRINHDIDDLKFFYNNEEI